MSYTFRKVNLSISFVAMGITGYCHNYVPTLCPEIFQPSSFKSQSSCLVCGKRRVWK